MERSGIAAADAERAGMFDVDDASTIYPEFKPVPAIVIPYYDPGGAIAKFERDGLRPFCRVRYLEPPKAAGFTKRKPMRYGQPRSSGTRAYFPPVIDWAGVLADPKGPLIITEGEKKSLAGVLAGFAVIGLGGVYNFMALAETLLPELDAIRWRDRDVYICFDSDVALNPGSLAAEARLVDELQRKRGAHCFLVRIPQEGESKIGLDDYLLKHGADAFEQLLKSAPSLGALDAKVVALNQSCAWIERENLVYDLKDKLFIPKDSFVTGSRFSALEHITAGGKQRVPKRISVARTWLTHPHAQRFREVLFRPGEGPTVEGEHGRPALNLWNGWEPEEGDVTPFLELSTFLFSNMKGADRELPLKLMAYKAQNPAEKIPLALVLLGEQGCGKSLWGECIRDALAPYSVDVTSKGFHAEFQGWLERSLFALINEAEHEDMLRGGDVLKSLISDLHRPMNEKYRVARQIKTYTMYMLTSNKRATGAFAADDRRMIVVDCPKKCEHDFYLRVAEWKKTGAKALLGWLLRYDLQGWIPPASAPMTAEKYMAFVESLTPVQRLAEEMRSATSENVKMWVDSATAWARASELSSNTTYAATARATLEGVKNMQVRDWYTPEELTLMFPAIIEQTLGSRFDRSTPAGKVSRELREAGVPYLQCADDPRGFKWKGMIRQYLIVANLGEWREPLRQADFERRMQHWPLYGQYKARAS